MSTNGLRLWLASVQYVNERTAMTEWRSSIVAHQILEAPFEIVSMSITLFVIGLGTYLGSCWNYNLPLSTDSGGNRGILIAFIIPTVFVLLMYGHMVGMKDVELAQVADIMGKDGLPKHAVAPVSSLDGGEAFPKQASSRVAYMQTRSVGSDTTTLDAALQVAADAHRRSAQASMEIASQYEHLLSRKPE